MGAGLVELSTSEYAFIIVMPTKKAWTTKLLGASLVERSKGKYTSTTMMMGMNIGIQDVLSSQSGV